MNSEKTTHYKYWCRPRSTTCHVNYFKILKYTWKYYVKKNQHLAFPPSFSLAFFYKKEILNNWLWYIKSDTFLVILYISQQTLHNALRSTTQPFCCCFNACGWKGEREIVGPTGRTRTLSFLPYCGVRCSCVVCVAARLGVCEARTGCGCWPHFSAQTEAAARSELPPVGLGKLVFISVEILSPCYARHKYIRWSYLATLLK